MYVNVEHANNLTFVKQTVLLSLAPTKNYNSHKPTGGAGSGSEESLQLLLHTPCAARVHLLHAEWT